MVTDNVVMDADDLYGLPLDRFVPERATLVRELRSGGDREQAAAASALRKPSVAAWAVNQLVRTQRRAVDELLQAGDALRDVQNGVIAGSADAGDLRAAAEGERAAVQRLVEAARGLLSSGGHELSAATLERVAETLHAAALDDEARGQVEGGRLVRELRHVGLGGGLGGAFAPAHRATPAPDKPARAARRSQSTQPSRSRAHEAERQATEEHRAAEAAQRRERDEARKEARATERDAAREVARAQRALRTAEERRTRAAAAVTQAEAAVQEAEASVQAAAAAHRQAKHRLDEL